MQRKKVTLLISLILLVAVSLQARSLEEIKRSGTIYVAFTSDDLRNINYPLALEFARYLNVELVEVEITWEEAFQKDGVIPAGLETDPSISYTPDALKKADIICSTFTILPWRRKLFGFAETLHSAELLMISKEEEQPRDFDVLRGKRIAFQRATTFEKNLNSINEELDGSIQLVPTRTGAEAQEMLTAGDVYGVVLDADAALNFNLRNGSNYKIAFPISEVSRTAWAVEKNNRLKQEVESFFETIASNGVLDEIFYRQFETRYSKYLEKIHRNLRYERNIRDLDEIRASGKLIVALRERSFIYKEDGQKQFMHALAEEFADYLGVSLEIIITPYFSKYWETQSGEVERDSAYTPEWFRYFDIACEVFAPLEWRLKKIDMVPVYPSEYAVIAHRDTRISSISDLENLQGVTGEETVYEDILRRESIDNYYYEKVNNFIPEVQKGNADYTIIYNAFYELSEYPELEVKLNLGELDVSWGIRKNQPELKKEIGGFIRESSEKGLIKILLKALQGNTLQAPEAYISSYYESFQTGQLPYVNYGADDGLPQEDIFSIFQDRKGYIWFGTNSGAVRYNGREMVVFDQEQGLPNNSVRDIRQDSTGNFYFATTDGVAVFRNDTVEETLFSGVSFRKIFIDSGNNKWLLGDDGVYLVSHEEILRSLNAEFSELPAQVFNLTEAPRSGIIYLATSAGIFSLDPEKNELQHYPMNDCFSVHIDVNDSIWYSTKTGLYISELEEMKHHPGRFSRYNLNQRLHFPTGIISDITTNKYGSVWLVTDSRIFQVISTDQSPIAYEQEIGIRNNKIHSFLIDREDNIWIGFSGGLQRLTNRKGLRNFYPNTINSYIYSIFQDSLERLWITSNNGVFYFDDALHSFPGNVPDNREQIGTRLPGGNILLVHSEGFREIDPATLQTVRSNRFPQLSLPPENMFISSGNAIFLLTGINGTIYYFPRFNSQPVILNNKFTSNIFQLTEYRGEVIGGNSDGIVRFNGTTFERVSSATCNIWSLHSSGDRLWLGTDCGLGLVENGRFNQVEIHPFPENTVIKDIEEARNPQYLWVGTNNGFCYYNTAAQEIEFRVDTKDGLSGDEITSAGLFLDNNDLLWVGTYHGISNFNIRAKSFRSYAPVCYIENILLNGEEISASSGSVFRHNQNNFVFEISALSFADEQSVEYEFYLRGTGNNYSSYHRGKEFKAYYNNLPAGHYEFIYKAKGKNNIWGYAEEYEFTIRKAWYDTWIFMITLALVLVLLTYLFYRIRLRAINAQKVRLEKQVRERTHELEEANSEIEAQRDLATEQRDKIAVQQKSIMDSIHYARRIQRSLLPSVRVLDRLLPEHFILFKPRDIVSGDFYWAAENNGNIYFTAADCTGHGVPGAFMSMLGMAFLNDIVNKFKDIEPDEILNKLRDHIIETLHQEAKASITKDGMDMVMCKIDKQKTTLRYACANNPLYLVRNGELLETKGEKMPVAIHDNMEPFQLQTVKIMPGDTVYIFSDGYADQFGGPDGKKFMYKRLRELFLSLQDQPMKSQGEILEQTIVEWKGTTQQIDDMVVIGIKF